MTNREWLNTLSDEEWVEKADIKADTMCFSGIRCRENDEGKSVDKCRECTLDWLKAPHEPTADEDFFEIGFRNYNQDDISASYIDKCDRTFFIQKNFPLSYGTGGDLSKNFSDIDIDQIRTIADKKRKEMGWK